MVVLDEACSIRFRVDGVRKILPAATEQEAIATKRRIESDQHLGLFIDYTRALACRYLRQEHWNDCRGNTENHQAAAPARAAAHLPLDGM